MNEYGRVKGKVAIITGAANKEGIGYATAKKFLAEGVKVLVICDIDPAIRKVAEELNASVDSDQEVFGVVTDVSVEFEVGQLVRLTKEKFKRIDIVVNNAAINIPGNFSNVNLKNYRKMYEVNVFSHMYMYYYATPIMIEQGSGVFVDMASANSLVSEGDNGGYGGTKGAIAKQSQSHALDVAKYGIRVVAIAPGLVHTGFNDAQHEMHIGGRQNIDEATSQPIGRSNTPAEVANSVCFYASDEASGCTGALYLVDGGYTAV